MLAAHQQWSQQGELEPIFMTLAEDVERRRHRRHDLEDQNLVLQRWDAARNEGTLLGQIVDLSAGGIRVKTRQSGLTPDMHVRVRLALPRFAGISPFIDHAQDLKPTTDWVGWMVICRVAQREDGLVDIAGRLVDMDEMDRGMLGLYLSTQPMAA